MKHILPTITRRTITLRGREIKVITKSKSPKPTEDLVVAVSCPAESQKEWVRQTEFSKEHDYDVFSEYMAEQLAHFNQTKRRRNRGRHGKR